MDNVAKKRVRKIDALKIRLASPDDILKWSHGEVTQAETINYRTYLPEEDGLFSQRIFGPVKDYECACGKYKGKKHENIVCDVCHVKVTTSKVRREWMGHITLNAPVAHRWYYGKAPYPLPRLLGLKYPEVKDIVYLNLNLVVDDGGPFVSAGVIVTGEGEEKVKNWYEGFRLEIEELKNSPRIPKNLPRVRKEIREKVVLKGEPRFLAGPKALEAVFSLLYEENYPVKLYVDLKYVWKARKVLLEKVENFIVDFLSEFTGNDISHEDLREILNGTKKIYFEDEQKVKVIDKKSYLLLTSDQQKKSLDGYKALAAVLLKDKIDGGDYLDRLVNLIREIPNRYGRWERLTRRNKGVELSMSKWAPNEESDPHLNLLHVFLPDLLIVVDSKTGAYYKETMENYVNRYINDYENRYEYFVNVDSATRYMENILRKLGREEAVTIELDDTEREILFNQPRIQVADIRVNITGLDVLTDDIAKNIKRLMGPEFKFGMGAEIIQQVLEKDFDNKGNQLRLWVEYLKHLERIVTSESQRRNIVRRLSVMEAFLHSESRPAWMILTIIPVIPPELRPIIPLEGGRFATSELNDLYRRVINRNNRLKKMMDKRAPEIILKNEKRLLQDAVDSLLDNSGKEKPVTDSSGRPLKSLTDILVKKEGRFRKNLLGKRVDYSGRSVIVIGPELELDQCGLPKEMAVELFKPFLINRLIKRGIAETFKEARELIDKMDDRIFDALEEVVKDHYVLLNRAPTLHRPSIEAFRPVLVDMKAISIPAMVCPPFNADFDGDQMAVHVPLSDYAQAEARLIMASSLNFISPANGTPLAAPSRDMVLGIYYLTMPFEGVKGEGTVISSIDEAFIKYRLGKTDLHAWVWYPIISTPEEIEQLKSEGKKGNTTIGRIIFNYEIGKRMKQYGLTKYLGKGFEIFKENKDDLYNGPRLDFVNDTLDKKKLQKLISDMVDIIGIADMKYFLDVIKDIGFHYATVSGSTISIQEVQVMPGKDEILAKALEQVERINEAYEEGIISYEERIPSIIEVWRKASEEIEKKLKELMATSSPDKLNSLYMMILSGARGNVDQLRQSVAFRGAVYDATGNILEIPVKSSYIEGLTVREYFDSTYGGRKGQVDTALSTSLGGYNTRRFEEAVHSIVVREDDHEVKEVDLNVYHDRELAHQIVGRLAAEDIIDSRTGEIIVKKMELIDEEKFEKIKNYASGKIKVFTELMWIDINSFLDDKNFLENLIHNRFKLAMDIVLENGDTIPAGSLITPVLVNKLKEILSNSGYGTEVLVRRIDGIMFRTLKNLSGDNIKDFFDRIKGRYLADDVISPKTKELLAKAGDYIDKNLIELFREHGVDHVYIKSPITCKTEYGVCVKCYGEDLARHSIVEKGEAVGIVAAQSLGEPATQLTLRTFHTGGTVGAKSEEITSEDSGLRLVEAVSTTPDSGLNKDERRFLQSIVRPITDFYKVLNNVEKRLQTQFDSLIEEVLVKGIGSIQGLDAERERKLRGYIDEYLSSYSKRILSVIDTVKLLVSREYNWTGLSVDVYEYLFEQIDNLDKLIASEGMIDNLKDTIEDIVDDETIASLLVRNVKDRLTDVLTVFVEYLAKLPGWFVMTAGIKGANMAKVKEIYEKSIGKNGEGNRYSDVDLHVAVLDAIKGLLDGEESNITDLVVKHMVKLDDNMEILDHKKAKFTPIAILSSVDGHVVEVETDNQQKSMYVVTKDEYGSYKLTFAWVAFTYLDPILGREVDIRFRPRFQVGDYIHPGDLLVVSRQRGFHRPVVRYPRVFLQILLDNFGLQAVADFLFSSIEGIYVDFQFDINDKHFEVIISQMLSKIEIYDDGDSDILVPFHDVDFHKFEAEYRYLKTLGRKTPKGRRKIWGTKDIGKLSDSWLAAASYLETAAALINAAIASKVDRLVGMKENVIVGSMIPAGTGIYDDSRFIIEVKGKNELPDVDN